MCDGSLLIGAGEDGFVNRSQVKLLVYFDEEAAAVAGPAVENPKWVSSTLYSLANQWVVQQPQIVPPMPVPPNGEEWLDCTTKDVAIVIYKAHDVVVKPGEIFPNSGLSAHYVDVAGRRRHETEWVVSALLELAQAIEQEEGFDYEL